MDISEIIFKVWHIIFPVTLLGSVSISALKIFKLNKFISKKVELFCMVFAALIVLAFLYYLISNLLNSTTDLLAIIYSFYFWVYYLALIFVVISLLVALLTPKKMTLKNQS